MDLLICPFKHNFIYRLLMMLFINEKCGVLQKNYVYLFDFSRRIEENGGKIYSSQFETNRVIENLVSGLDDEYTYYRSPSIDGR